MLTTYYNVNNIISKLNISPYRFAESCSFVLETFGESVQIVLGSGGVIGCVVEADQISYVTCHGLEFIQDRCSPIGFAAGSTLDLNRHNSCLFWISFQVFIG